MPKSHSSEGSSALSPTSGGPQPTWGPPKSPLPPHRLAKLANALGVATPVPATYPQSSAPAPSTPGLTPGSATPDLYRRSPTPSAASTQFTSTASTSKFLLHVIPPNHLPHESDDLDQAPPPPTASGYHTQFRRGVLVPVYSNLQSQLTAIAREYALPSTVGMVLYLITTLNSANKEEPGPRISEEIWRHIWTRVLRVEKDEMMTPGPRPLGLGLGFGAAGRSSPALLQDVPGNPPSQLRALIPPRIDTAPTPSPSTPSQSVYSSQSEVDTPESASSIDPPTLASSLPLPGLESPALVPVLAKVEFDIDKKKAAWYPAWVRSRRNNHAKRSESRLGTRMAKPEDGDGEESTEEGKTRKAPIDLELVGKMNGASPNPSFFVSADPEDIEEEGYQQLEDDEDVTARLNGAHGNGDPLEDVFGSDADTWADMHGSGSRSQTNPNVVDLALDASAVSNLSDNLEEGDTSALSIPDDEADVTEILNRMPKPPLTVSIPSEVNGKRQSSPTTAGTTGTVKKHVPPPLHLIPHGNGELVVPEQASPMPSSAGSAQLAYLNTPSSEGPQEETDPAVKARALDQAGDDDDDDSSLDEDLLKQVRIRSPEDEKRDGAFFNDLNLGLDPSLTEDGFDETDPYDRRKSQYIMAAQLDEIEKTLAQFSPRRLKSVDLKPEDLPTPSRRSRPSLSSRSPSIASALSPKMNGNLSPPPKSPGPGASWPAVPYSTLNTQENEDAEDRPPSPPTIAFNGITTEAPKSFQKLQRDLDAISNETLMRQRALDEERGLYPPLTVPNLYGSNRGMDSPVIPLSPDPFGRYPTEAEATQLQEERQSQIFEGTHQLFATTLSNRDSSLNVSTTIVNESRPPSQTPSSRFSMDSLTSEEVTKGAAVATNGINNNTSTNGGTHLKTSSSLMSVKSIRKLWRKSDSKRQSVSSTAGSESGRVSPHAPPPSGHGRSRSKSTSKAPPPPTPPVPGGAGLYAPPMPAREEPIRSLRFDQESPYPIHPRSGGFTSPSPPPSMSMSRPPSQQAQRPPSQQAQRPPSVSQQPGERSSVRKSILKSFRSGNLSISSKSSSSTSRSSNEQPPEAARKRRPSMLDIASGAMRSSGSLGSATLADIPPSPALPEQYANHARSASRQSQNTLSGASRPSMSSAASSSPRMRSPLMAAGSPPQNGLGVRYSHASTDSYESRPSFDASQFEMVSPPKASLSYPYHSLDQSVISSHE